MRRSLTGVFFVAFSLCGVADAAFVGMNVVGTSTSQGADTFHVYRVYAQFDAATDTVLNVYGMSALPAGNFWHQDFLTGPGGSNSIGTWSPAQVSAGDASLDSWVTVGGAAADLGNTTTAEPGWGAPGFAQAGIPAGAGWYNSFPPNLQGRADPGTLQTLIAQFVFKNTVYGFSTPITIGYNQGIGTPAQFGIGALEVPGPGAIAVLGLAGLAGRRRRG